MSERRSSLSLDVSAVPARPGGAGYYTIASGAGIGRTRRRRSDARGPPRRRGALADWCLGPAGPGRRAGERRGPRRVPASRPGRLVFEQMGLAPVLRRLGVAVHHGPHYTMPARAPVPCAVTVHDCTFFDHPEWHVRSKVAFFRRAIRRAATHAARGHLRQPGHRGTPRAGVRRAGPGGGGAPRRRPRPVHPARAGRGRRPGRARPRRAIPLDRPLVAFVGTLEPRKGVVPLVRGLRPGGRHRSRRRAGAWPARAGGAWPRPSAPSPRRATRRASCAPGTCPTTPSPRCCVRPPWSPTRPSRRVSGCPPSRRWPAARRSSRPRAPPWPSWPATPPLLTAPGDVAGLAGRSSTALAERPPRPGRRDLGHGRGGGADVGGQRGAATSTAYAAGPRTPARRVPHGACADHRRQGLRRPAGSPRTWPSTATTSSVIDIETDVADGAAVRPVMDDVQPDAVYHLAARTHVGECWEDPSEVLRVNVLGTAESWPPPGRPTSAPRVLVVSSAEVYGIVAPEQLPLTEDSPARPGQPVRGEQAGRRGGRPAGLARLRPAGHRGPPVQPRRPGAVAQLLRPGPGQAHRRGPAFGRGLAAGGDPHHAARLHRRTRRRGGLPARWSSGGEPGRVYNVCSGRDVAMSEVAARLLDLAGCRPLPRDRPGAGAPGGRPGAARRRRPARGGHRVASRRSRWPTRWPTSWPRGRREAVRAEPATVGAARRPAPSGVGGWRRCGHEVHGGAGQVVEVLHAAGHAVAHAVEALVDGEVLVQPVLQLDALHLGALVAEHAEADGDVGRIAGQVGDAPRDDGEAGRSRRACWRAPLSLVREQSIALVKQLQALWYAAHAGIRSRELPESRNCDR